MRILAGNQTYNLQNFTLDSSTGIENNSGNLSIDISALGGLKAGSIELVSSEENLNVNYKGNTTANNLNITVTGDLSFNTDFQNNGNINATILNFQVGGDFSYDDANNDFVLNENDNLVVLGSAFVTADNYTQSGAIDIAGDLSIQVTNEARLDDTASIKAKNLFFSVYDFYNQADFTITGNATFDIGNNFWNGFYLDGYHDGGNIHANNFNVVARYFVNYYNTTISADNFNVTARGFGNYGNINTDSFISIVSNRFSLSNYANIYARDLTISTDIFYNDAEQGGIYADNFNLTTDEFSNWGINVVNNFTIKVADRLYNTGTIITDHLNIVVENSFRNSHEEGIIEAINFNATVDSFLNDKDSRIKTTNFNVTARIFTNDDYQSITALVKLLLIPQLENSSVVRLKLSA